MYTLSRSGQTGRPVPPLRDAHDSKSHINFTSAEVAELADLPAGRQARIKNMYYVYVLKSLKNGTFYKGLTNNLEKRIKQHELGQCLSTRNIRPLVLIHVEICSNRIEARKIEKYIKSGIGREIIKEFLESNLKI